MALWKMGVAAFIPNNSFKYGKRIYALINMTGDWTSGTTITYNEDSGTADGLSDGLIKYLRATDRILVGPSTLSGYEGATQTFVVSSVSSTTIGVSSTQVVKFANNDPITGIGSNFPGGWEADDDADLIMGGITNHDIQTLTTTEGNMDRFSVQFRNNDTVNERGIKFILNEGDYLADVYYRTGLHYQFNEVSSAELKIVVNSNSVDFIDDTIATADAQTAWTEYNSAAALSESLLGDEWYVKVLINADVGYGIANIDNIYVEHAAETDDATSAVYTFDDYPALGSRKFTMIRGSTFSRLKNSRLIRSDSTGGGDKNKKYVVSCSFANVTRTLRENLETLIDWQDRGKYLVLHHDMPSVPPNLQGVITIKDTNMAHWDAGKCSFNFMFEEA